MTNITEFPIPTEVFDPKDYDDVFNVKHFGAAGDGVTDDREAIQSALDAANANGGGTVYLPAGTYSIATKNSVGGKHALEVFSNTRVIGDGYGGTIIKAATALVTDTPLVYCEDAEYISISNLEIDGNRVARGATGGVEDEGIDTKRSNHLTFENLYIHHTGQDAIDLDEGSYIHIRNVHAYECGGNGLHLTGVEGVDDGVTNLHVSGVVVENCGFLREAASLTKAAGIHWFGSNGYIEATVLNCVRVFYMGSGSNKEINLNFVHASELELMRTASGATLDDTTILRLRGKCTGANTQQMIRVINYVLADSVIEAATSLGIVIIDSGGHVKNCRLINTGTGKGIEFVAADGASVESTYVETQSDAAVRIGGCPNSQILGGHFKRNNAGSVIDITAGSVNSQVVGTKISGSGNVQINSQNDSSHIQGVYGTWLSDRHFTTTIPDGSSSVTLAHGLTVNSGVMVGSVQLTPRGNEAVWVSGLTAANVTISRVGTAGNLSVMCSATTRGFVEPAL